METYDVLLDNLHELSLGLRLKRKQEVIHG